MGSSFLRDPFPLPSNLSTLSLVPQSFFTSLGVFRVALGAAGYGPVNMDQESSLPPSLIPHLYDRPQERQHSSPTSSSLGTQDDVELPGPLDTTRQTAYPLRPLVSPPRPNTLTDTHRSYSGYESGAHEHSVALHPPLESAGPSSIPHGSTRRYRSPGVGDPNYYTVGRPQQAPPPYAGARSLPLLSLLRSHWAEGEAGPSSLAHSHQYGDVNRQISPRFSPPQPIHRRATEPGSLGGGSHHVQLPLHSYERFRDPPVGYPPRPLSDLPYSDARQSTVSLPPLYLRSGDWPYGAPRTGEQEDLPPLLTAIRSHSPVSSEYTRVDDGEKSGYMRGVRRKLPDDFEENPRHTNIPKKILVACDFCRGRKLRCDGRRPICSNCNQRGEACVYRSAPKRRGPGKAAKGTRAKKRAKAGRLAQGKDVQFPEPEAGGPLDNSDELTLVPSRTSTELGMYSQTTFVHGSPEERTRPRKRRRSNSTSAEYYSPSSEDKGQR